jgi:hypothetical protein
MKKNLLAENMRRFGTKNLKPNLKESYGSNDEKIRQELFKKPAGIGEDDIIFSVDDDKLDQLLHDFHKRELDYVNIKGDEYYILPQKDFDRFIDAAASRGFDVDYENSEDTVVYVID